MKTRPSGTGASTGTSTNIWIWNEYATDTLRGLRRLYSITMGYGKVCCHNADIRILHLSERFILVDVHFCFISFSFNTEKVVNVHLLFVFDRSIDE